MTPLRLRMLEDMQLRGFSARTQGCYVAAVRRLAEHYHRSPDQLTEEDLRQYFLYLANEKKVARATATIGVVRDSVYACGLRLLEGARLQVADVDSARMVVHVHGKGKQDRYVPLIAESTTRSLIPSLR